ncbi:MAG: endonuclease III [Gammaproteobacteria bacterium]|nr:endonuclease III [Gammaproteobacteria bacterium]
MRPEKIAKIFQILAAKNPRPITELKYNSNFELLIAVILSAQATDISVNKATEILFKIANTPKKILALRASGLKKYIKNIGLYNAKANNILKTCKILIEQFNSTIPQKREELEKLPGVGRKTANVILNVAFKQPTIAVDTHVFRVCNRTGIAYGKTPLEVETSLEKTVPQKFKLIAGHLLLLHGRYICKAKNPLCLTCPINKICENPLF